MIVKTKILAVVVGTVGIGIFSLLQNISNLIFVVIPFGSAGFTKYIAKYYYEKRFEKISFLVKTILIHNLPISVVFGVLLILFSGNISNLLYSESSLWKLIVIFSFSLPFGLVSGLIDMYLRSIRSLMVLLRSTFYSAIISLAIFVPLTIYWQLEGTMLSIILSYATNIVVGYIMMKKYDVFPNMSIVKSVEDIVIKRIYGVGLAMFLMLIFQQVSFLFIRTVIIKHLGIDKLGIYQSVYALSINYFGLFFLLIASYGLPKLSSISGREELKDEINKILKFVLYLYTPLLMICFVFRAQIITILYDSSFLEAEGLLFYQLIGEFLKAISWVVGLWYIPTGLKIRQWMLFDISNNLLYVLLCYIFMSNELFGLKSVSISYLITYTVFMFVQIVYAKRIINFRFKYKSLSVMLSSLSAVLLVFSISEFNRGLGYYLFVPVLILWGTATISKNEMKQAGLLIVEFLKTNFHRV